MYVLLSRLCFYLSILQWHNSVADDDPTDVVYEDYWEEALLALEDVMYEIAVRDAADELRCSIGHPVWREAAKVLDAYREYFKK